MKKLWKMTGCVLGLLVLGAALPAGAWGQTTSRATGLAVNTAVANRSCQATVRWPRTIHRT